MKCQTKYSIIEINLRIAKYSIIEINLRIPKCFVKRKELTMDKRFGSFREMKKLLFKKKRKQTISNRLNEFEKHES